MTDKPENPPAFPVPSISDGMTLRDWFAGQALAGLLGGHGHVFIANGNSPRNGCVRMAFEYADLMLAERAK